jgi:hypothetical protein
MHAFRTLIIVMLLSFSTAADLFAQAPFDGTSKQSSPLATGLQNRKIDRLGGRQRMSVGAPGVRAQGQTHFGTTSSVPVGVNSDNSR